MPNWSEGVLKIRGTKENIENFIKNGISYNDYSHEFVLNKQTNKRELVEKPIPRNCEKTIDDYQIFIKDTMDLWIKNTRRMFVNSGNILIDFNDNEIETVYLDIRQAWAIIAENLQDMSKKWKLDFRIFATEQGMGFCQDIEVINGKITKNDEIKFDDFSWEAPDPRLGE